MDTPTLLSYLADEAIVPITRKVWFSGECVRLGLYMWRAQSLFETCAALGYTFRDKLNQFARLLGSPGQENEILTALSESAGSQLAHLEKEPRDFFDLFFKPEVEKLLKVMRDARRTRYSEWTDFPKVVQKKLRRDNMLFYLRETARTGIGFGSRYPEMTVALFARTPDEEVWDQVRFKGANIPPAPPEPRPMQTREAEATALVQPFVETYYPDLLARIGLWPQSADTFQLRWRALAARCANAKPPREGDV